MDNIEVVQQTSLSKVGQGIFSLLSQVSEAEFVQMALPLVRLMPLEVVRTLLLNCTTEEIEKVVRSIQDADILNAIAVETGDGIVAAETAKHELATVKSLRSIFERFANPYHVSLCVKHKAADANLLYDIWKFLTSYHKPETKTKLFCIGENEILFNMASHHAASSKLLFELITFVESLIQEMHERQKDVDAFQEEHMSKQHSYYPSKLTPRELEKYPVGQAYDLAMRRVKAYFRVLLAAAGNSNTFKKDLRRLLKEYGNKSVYNIDKEIPGLAMQMLGHTHSDTVGYRVLSNPSLDDETREKHLATTLDQNRGIYESGSSGEEYLQRIVMADDPKIISILYDLWCKEDVEKSGWSFRHVDLRKFVEAIGKNKNAPANVMDALIERICKKCSGSDSIVYFEYTDPIAGHPGFGPAGILAFSNAMSANEQKSKSYMDACIPGTLIPLAGNTAMTAEATRVLYDLMVKMGNRGIEPMGHLADNNGATGLDEEFSTSPYRLVRCNYAKRSNDLDWLTFLQNDSDRDVVVAARRRYAELTGETPLSLLMQRTQFFLGNSGDSTNVTKGGE